MSRRPSAVLLLLLGAAGSFAPPAGFSAAGPNSYVLENRLTVIARRDTTSALTDLEILIRGGKLPSRRKKPEFPI